MSERTCSWPAYYVVPAHLYIMFATVNGLRIHYEVSGQGPPLVMLHSNCRDMSSLDNLASVLGDHYTLYRVDSRGHGESQGVDEYHYRDMASDIFHLIGCLGLDRPVLYGHGDGGVVGLILASEHPGLLSKMIVSGANTTPDELDGWDMRKFRRREVKGKNDPRVSMMLREPSIGYGDLERIDVPVFITAGEYDVVNRSDTMKILRGIAEAELHIVHNGDRDNYVIADKALGRTILDWLDRTG